VTLLYPWHHALWENIKVRRTTKRLPHALLLTGPAGLGKRVFAATVVQALACERPQEDGRGCDSCSGCRLQRAGSHPDHMALLPQEGKQAITIDQIRQAQMHLALKARQSGCKTVTIFPAEEMTLNAANSLLKVLEEPPGETLVILIASALSRLPLTLRSRCQRLAFLPPKPKEVQFWLQEHLSSASNLDFTTLLALTGGAPLRALKYVEQDLLTERRRFIKDLFLLAEGKGEALDVAQSWFKKDLGEPLYWVSMLVGDMIRLKSGISDQYLLNRDVADLLQAFTQRVAIKTLFALLEKVNRDLWLWQGPTRVNSQLLLEGLLIYWALCFNEVNHECR
jgi:DNA polymerase III subunit delta'